MVDQHYNDLRAAVDRLTAKVDHHGDRIAHIDDKVSDLEAGVAASAAVNADAIGRLESQLASIDGNGLSAADVLLRLVPLLDVLEPHLGDLERLIATGGGWLGRLLGGGAG